MSATPPDNQPNGNREPRAYGVLLALGLLLGVGAGIPLGQPSAGAVVGIALGALVALALRLAGR